MEKTLYSVWDWRDGRYLYFTGPKALEEIRPRLRPPLGDPPERLAPELPPGATYIGKGDLAYGTIARPRPCDPLRWAGG